MPTKHQDSFLGSIQVDFVHNHNHHQHPQCFAKLSLIFFVPKLNQTSQIFS